VTLSSPGSFVASLLRMTGGKRSSAPQAYKDPMDRRIVTAVLVALAAGACSGADVTITGSEEGVQVLAPPVDARVDDEGVQGPPTPTPRSITPVYPITTPGPPPTPRA
jgi:hypothetical protein